MRFLRSLPCFSRTSRRFSQAPTTLLPTKDVWTIDSLVKPFKTAGLPVFTAQPESIGILYHPKDFYQTLLESIHDAKERIFLSSLYIGKEETQLVEALHNALSTKPKLELSILVDYLRSTREHPSPSSASLISTLSRRFPDRVKIGLWHTPELYGWRRLTPKRLNEGWGLQHMKCYGFDERVIISGANLSNDYFTNRQDRYIIFDNNQAISNYLYSLHRLFVDTSYILKGRSSSDFDLVWTNPAIPSPTTDRRSYISSVSSKLQEFLRRPNLLSSPQGSNTVVVPNLQMGSFGLRQETDQVIPNILELQQKLSDDDAQMTVDWTSGYFSVRPEDQESILQNENTNFRIVSASPQANGFLNSKGVSRHVPPAYMHLEQQFLQAVRRRDRQSTIEIKEWIRDGWTYHAKGIWLSPLDSQPFLTLVGSSNYGRRSATRDLEANLVILTLDPNLRNALDKELKNIRQWATLDVDEEFVNRPERHIHWGVKVAAKCISTML